MRQRYRYCGDPDCCATLVRRPVESRARFAIREHCNLACALRHRNRQRGQIVQAMAATRFCPHCGKPIVPLDDEKISRARKRVTCGRAACVFKQRSDSRRGRTAPMMAAPTMPAWVIPAGMTPAEAIAAFLAERGATRCPTAAVAATTAQPSPADIAALVAYRLAEDARRAASKPNFAWGG